MITGYDPVAVDVISGTGFVAASNPLPLVGSDEAVFIALKAFLHAVLPELSNRQVVRGQSNSVPMPTGPNFVVMVPTGRYWLSTTVRNYKPDVDLRETQLQTRGEYNISFYGPAAPEMAQTFAILWRDLYGCDFLRGYQIQPLYAGEARQMPLIDDAKQYEQRYLVQAFLQFNPVVSTAQQFADILELTFLEADKP